MKDPYLYDDVDVLINLQGIKDQSRLDDFNTINGYDLSKYQYNYHYRK